MAHETVALKPWITPNFAQFNMPPGKRQDGMRELPSVSVKDLSQAALDDLAKHWLAELYEKAGKPSGWHNNSVLDALQAEYERCTNLARTETDPALKERFSGLAVGVFFAIERLALKDAS